MSISVEPTRTIPGVYAQVFEEGLIRAPLGTQGVIGIIGTARKGPLLTPITVGSFTEARRAFGDLDENLTLIKSAELAFDNGATRVVGVRTGPATTASITFTGSSSITQVLTLFATDPGEWGESVTTEIQYASTTDKFTGVGISVPFTLSFTPTGSINSSTYPCINATIDGVSRNIAGVTGSDVYLSGSAPGTGATVLINYNYTQYRKLLVSITGSVLFGVGYRQEIWNNLVSTDDIVNRVNVVITGSTLISGSVIGVSPELPAPATGSNLSGGDDGASAVLLDYINGLTILETVDPCNIVCVAGQYDPALHASVQAHVETMSDNTNEKNRIGIVGTELGEADDEVFSRMDTLDSNRMILIHPGLQIISRQTSQPVYRSGAYMAAAAAGKLSSLPVHYSLTNKTLTGMYDLETRIGRAVLSEYIENRITAIFVKNGIRVLKGITTSSDPAWQQITTMRITDAAIDVVRTNAQPYIGKLNNKRIRAALQASIEAGLYDMFLSEMLVDWTENGVYYPGSAVTVYASRDDEIMGVARVDIRLRPVFSIDYIIVSIYLE